MDTAETARHTDQEAAAKGADDAAHDLKELGYTDAAACRR